jgi:hypothetical protein
MNGRRVPDVRLEVAAGVLSLTPWRVRIALATQDAAATDSDVESPRMTVVRRLNARRCGCRRG